MSADENPPRGDEYDPLDGMGALVVPTVIGIVVAVIGAIAGISALARWGVG
ncbi:MAG: hypothetical protein AMXMBFR78_11560 [Rubrivivax sp.]|jgi:hypothetical protein